jgi:hypothetical protein
VKRLIALLALSVPLGMPAYGQESQKPFNGEFIVHGSESCTWTIAITDAEEWIKRGQPKELFRCDGIGVKKLNVSIEGRRVDGSIWLHNATDYDDKPVTVVLDLLDGDRVINNQVENSKRFDLKRGNVLKVKVKDKAAEREGYDIYANEQFDPAKINLRITVIPVMSPAAK